MPYYRLLFVVSCVLFIGCIERFKIAGVWFLIFCMIFAPWITHTSDSSWATLLQGYPMLLSGTLLLLGMAWSNEKGNYKEHYAEVVRYFFPFALALHMATAVIGCSQETYYSAGMGILTILTLDYKNWTYNERGVLGMRATRTNLLWLWIYILWHAYFTYLGEELARYLYHATTILPICLGLSLLISWHHWFLFRIFSLVFVTILTILLHRNWMDPIYLDALESNMDYLQYLQYPIAILFPPSAALLIYLRSKEYGWVRKN